jgi:hypothetical protein
LAAQGYHPAVWSAFVIFGRPEIRLSAPHVSEATAWPSQILRLAATVAKEDSASAQALLAEDGRLSDAARAAIQDTLDGVFEVPSTPVNDEDEPFKDELNRYSESLLANMVLRALVRLRHRSARPKDWSRSQDLSSISLTQRTLGDSYLLVALTRELTEDLSHVFRERQTFHRGVRRLRWLNADANLEATSAELKETASRTSSSIAFDLATLTSVDPETFEAADKGNRDAQKKMLSELWKREARPEATLAKNWKPWFLRAIGAGTTG